MHQSQKHIIIIIIIISHTLQTSWQHVFFRCLQPRFPSGFCRPVCGSTCSSRCHDTGNNRAITSPVPGLLYSRGCGHRQVCVGVVILCRITQTVERESLSVSVRDTASVTWNRGRSWRDLIIKTWRLILWDGEEEYWGKSCWCTVTEPKSCRLAGGSLWRMCVCMRTPVYIFVCVHVCTGTFAIAVMEGTDGRGKWTPVPEDYCGA